MNAEIERAMCQRWYSGLAGKEHAGKPATAEMAWQERAEIAERHERELVEALQDLIKVCEPNLYPQPDKPNSPYGKLQRARAVLANYSDEVAA